MKFHGDANLQQNELQNAVIPLDVGFPANPKVGQLSFWDKTLYICVSIVSGLPAWVPLTREINMYVHAQPVASATWTINHNLNSGTVSVQTFGLDNKMFMPSEITITSQDQVVVDVGVGAAGRAIVLTGHMFGNERPNYAFEFFQTSLSSSWVVPHNLGYYPVVRVFIGTDEVQPSLITHDSINQVTIEFSTAYVGQALMI